MKLRRVSPAILGRKENYRGASVDPSLPPLGPAHAQDELPSGAIPARNATMEAKVYKPQQWNLSGLVGISDQTLEMHFKLYEGYVKATNDLNARIAAILADGKVDQEEFADYSELNRRLGFEYNGMVLHEYYFDNLKKGGGIGDPNRTSAFLKAAEKSFGSYQTWKAEFVGIGKSGDKRR